MFSLTKRIGATAMCSLAVLAFGASEGRAQLFAPIYPGGPTYGQYLRNIQAFGQAIRSVPPYALGYNPYVHNVAVAAPAANPYSLPYGATMTANPYASMYSGSPGLDFSLYNNPYSGYGNWWDPYGGFLRGTADVINAQGKFAQDQQKAVLIREQIKSERIANRRKMVDEYLYERDKLPTLQDERERTMAQELRRSLTDPPVTEIWSAKALNDLLAELQKQSAKGVMTTYRGPKEPLDQEQLKLINVTSANRGGNIGLLKNGGRLSWPLALTGPEFKEDRDRLSTMALDAVKEAEFNNRVDAGSLRTMNEDLDRIQKQLSRMVGDVPTAQYIEGKRFLSNLADALKVMGQPDAASYINRKYAAKGKTVPDLVKYMTENGLQFAPAVSGDEAAYVALQRALASYATGLSHSGGEQR
jgi:hypothetical protein